MQGSPLQRGVTLYKKLACVGSYLQPFILLLIRLAWGWELAESGYGHLTHVAETVKNFTDWGIPFPTPNVYLSGSMELVGGVLLMLGLCARLISIPLFFNFCVAYLTASRDTVTHLFSQDPSKFIDDAAFPFLVTSLLILAFGPGKISLDAVLGKLLTSNKGTASPHV